MRLIKSSLLFLLALSSPAMATDYRLLDLDHIDLEYYKVVDNRDDFSSYGEPGSIGEHWVDGAAINFNLTAVQIDDYSIYWDNKVHMLDTEKQVREVGWEWTYGLDIKNKVDFFWYHHSQHVLDATGPEPYPLQNYYGVKVNFYDRKTNETK